MGVDKKYLFIYNSPLLGTLKSYFFPKQSAEKQDDFVVIDDTNMIYDHGIEAYLPSGIIGVNQNYILCQDYVVDGRDQFGYIAYRLTKEKASLSCLQLFLSSLYQNIEEGEVVSKKPFNMEFDGILKSATLLKSQSVAAQTAKNAIFLVWTDFLPCVG